VYYPPIPVKNKGKDRVPRIEDAAKSLRDFVVNNPKLKTLNTRLACRALK
jgi:hypothetical protein